MKPLPDFAPYFDRAAVLPGAPASAATHIGRKYRTVEAATYHAWPAVNAGLLKEPTAAHMLHSLREEENDHYASAAGAEALTVGTLTHWATLEPEKIHDFNSHIVLCPTKGLATKEAASVRAANPGKLLVGPEHARIAYALREAIEAHHEARELLSQPGLREASGFLFEDGLWRKWRPDFLPLDHSAIIDVKSTRVELAGDYGKQCWIRECWSNGYWGAAAWYLHHHEQLTGMRPARWIWIAVSKCEPFYARVFTMENVRPDNPLYAQSMLCRARQMIGLDGASRLTAFVDSASRTRTAAENGTKLDARTLRQLWEANENEAPGPEIGFGQMAA